LDKDLNDGSDGQFWKGEERLEEFGMGVLVTGRGVEAVSSLSLGLSLPPNFVDECWKHADVSLYNDDIMACPLQSMVMERIERPPRVLNVRILESCGSYDEIRG